MSIGQRIKHLREAAQITQEELAKQVGTTKQTIYKYENEIITNIPLDRLELIAKIFHVSPAYLIGWDMMNDPVKALQNALMLQEATNDLNKLNVHGKAEACKRIRELTFIPEYTED